MKKEFVVSILAVFLFFGELPFVFACKEGHGGGSGKVVAEETKAGEKAIDVGNEVCPVMGGQIIKGKEIKVEHEGKIYNLCCPGCIATFKNDPQKYIEKVKEQMGNKEESDYCFAGQSCAGTQP
ncbi:MAG: YHS domain-containing protein [Candidatus Omnitrophica bacterium]|nr:YHS domain-containing protein [Candidatus Omnitrophota bacterium]